MCGFIEPPKLIGPPWWGLLLHEHVLSGSVDIPFSHSLNTLSLLIIAGPGKWELQAHKAARPSKCRTTDITKATPTATHMMFVKLCEEGLLRCVVSQNVDGLHRRSGLGKNSK